MAVQLASVGDDRHSSYGGRGTVDIYDGGSRPRSKSVADPSRQYTRDGRPILHYGKNLNPPGHRAAFAGGTFHHG